MRSRTAILMLIPLLVSTWVKAQQYSRSVGDKQWETTNHLGNVVATTSDRKLAQTSGSSAVLSAYETDIVSHQDYYPYGMLLEGRAGDDGYRFGFNGMERDDEVKGEGSTVNYTYRLHDTRIGRFFAVDPYVWKFAYYSPYHFSSNSPIISIELEGLESSVKINFAERSVILKKDDFGRFEIAYDQIYGNNYRTLLGSNDPYAVRRAFIDAKMARTDFFPGSEVDVWCADCGSSGEWWTITLPKVKVVRDKEIIITKMIWIDPSPPEYEEVEDTWFDDRHSQQTWDIYGTWQGYTPYTNSDKDVESTVMGAYTYFDESFAKSRGYSRAKINSIDLVIGEGLDVEKYKRAFQKKFGIDDINVSTDSDIVGNYTVKYHFIGYRLIKAGTPGHWEEVQEKKMVKELVSPVEIVE